MEEKIIYENYYNKVYNGIIWTHKIQKTYLEHLEFMYKLLRVIYITLEGFASVSTIVTIIWNKQILATVFSMITVLGLITGEVIEKLKYKDTIDEFKRTSSSLYILKNEMEAIKDEIYHGVITNEILKVKIDKINTLLCENSNYTSTIPDRYVNKASLKINERKDEEVDYKL